MSGHAVVHDDELRFWLRPGWWLQAGRSGIALFVANAFGFLTSVIAARALGPPNFGTVVLAVAAVTSVATFLDLSLEEAVVHHGAVAIARRDGGALRALLRTSFVLDVAVGGVVFVLLLFLAAPLATLAGGPALAPILVRLAAVESLAVTANGTTAAALMLSGRPELRAWAMAWTTALRLLSVFVAVHVFGGGMRSVLVAYAIGSAVGSVAQGLLAWRVARRRWPITGVPDPRPSLRALAGFGFHSSITTTIIAVRLALVSILLARLAGPAEVGLFAVAMLPLVLADVASAPLRVMTFPEQAMLAARGRLDVLRTAILAYTRFALLIGTLAAVAGWFLIPRLIALLYSSSFSEAIVPARIFLPAAVGTLAVAWSKALPAAVGRPNLRTWVSLVELALSVPLVAILAPSGATGAAIAVASVSLLTACAWLVVARRMLAGVARDGGKD
jgi:O-antigen/teichoic acid export membrane protein